MARHPSAAICASLADVRAPFHEVFIAYATAIFRALPADFSARRARMNVEL